LIEFVQVPSIEGIFVDMPFKAATAAAAGSAAPSSEAIAMMEASMAEVHLTCAR
jgi:hypothetical protein